MEKIEGNWSSLNRSQRQIIELLFEHLELNVSTFAQALALTEQAIRYNLRHLIKLGIVERLSEKTRDPDALYRFLNK